MIYQTRFHREPLAALSPEARCIVVIHGTFSPGSVWTEPDSAFCKAIADAFPESEIYQFRWNGWNTHSARVIAAIRLSELLTERSRIGAQTRKALEPVHIVAHSHGGNVAIYAANLAPQGAVCSICTLDTPYITAVPRDCDSSLELINHALDALASQRVCFFAAITSAWGLMNLGVKLTDWHILPFCALPVVAPWIASWLQDKHPGPDAQSRLCQLLNTTVPPGVHVHCAKAMLSETNIVLRLVSAVSEFPIPVWKYLVVGAWPILSAILTLVLLVSSIAKFESGAFVLWAVVFALPAYFGIAAVGLLIFLAGLVAWNWVTRSFKLRGFSHGFGEDFWHPLLARISINNVPSGGPAKSQMYMAKPAGWLHHSGICFSREVIRDSLDWMRTSELR